MSVGVSPGPAGPAREPVTAPVVRTGAGAVAGSLEQHGGRTLAVFRGVPYAEPPTGPFRFRSPRRPAPWSGVRDASRFGPAFLQAGRPDSSEDALFANVWTPGTDGSRPVLIYVHGGGWQVGAGSVPTFDGAAPAARGDLVVVTFNYRLGVFGWGLHEELTDPDTGHAANWGLQDQLALVRWVRQNAAAFGGDPEALTLCGTSAGGATAWQLAAHPELRGALRSVVAISAAHAWQPAASLSPEDATGAYDRLARMCGTTVPGLREAPAERLRAAWAELFSGEPASRAFASGREYRGPVPDGRTMPGYSHQLPPLDVPLMSVHNSTEGSFFTDPLSPSFPPAPPAPTDEAGLRGAVHDVLLKCAPDVPRSAADDCVDAYREAALAEGLPADPRTLWTEVWGDGLFRYLIVRLAERHARTRPSPQYVMEFAQPTLPPHYGTPHDATSKFLFGSHRLAEHVAQFGDGPAQRIISDTFVDLVASFARGGAPCAPGVPHWPVFSPHAPSTLVLGGPKVARIAVTPKLRQLRFWDTAGLTPHP